VRLLRHRRLVDVVVSRDAVVVSDRSQFLHIVHVVMTDVDIEHDCVTVVMLPFDKVVEVRSDRFERFG
jgi:hypothetical protein